MLLIGLLQPFAMRFPHADIHKLLAGDLLHQAIKGTYKDHLVTWVEEYLKLTYGLLKAEGILDEVDCQYVRLLFFDLTKHVLIFTALHWHLSFQDSRGPNKARTLSSGPGMI